VKESNYVLDQAFPQDKGNTFGRAKSRDRREAPALAGASPFLARSFRANPSVFSS